MAEDPALDHHLDHRLDHDHDLDLTQWPRRATFDFYRDFAQPFFSVCTRVDVAALKPALARLDNSAHTATITLACHYLALQLANRMAPFRYRLLEGRVRVVAAVHASTTVLRADDSFGFAYLRHDSDYPRFATHGALALAAARVAEPTRLGWQSGGSHCRVVGRQSQNCRHCAARWCWRARPPSRARGLPAADSETAPCGWPTAEPGSGRPA